MEIAHSNCKSKLKIEISQSPGHIFFSHMIRNCEKWNYEHYNQLEEHGGKTIISKD